MKKVHRKRKEKAGCCGANPVVLSEESFNCAVCRERKRAERNGSRMLLVPLDVSGIEPVIEMQQLLDALTGRIHHVIRETDVCGWLKTGKVLCLLFTYVPSADGASEHAVQQKVRDLFRNVPHRLRKRVAVSTHAFPQEAGAAEWGEVAFGFNTFFYPDLFCRLNRKLLWRVLKRSMDLLGAGVLLVLFAPLFLVVGILIKLTSPGPIFFRQVRIGQFGRPFTIYKFRSMHVDCDSGIHRSYMKSFIQNDVPSSPEDKDEIFKIRNDPRLTPIGILLRRTSIDEFPQILNVLKGEMSLVGPRPAIPYEVNEYKLWHRNRIFAVQPGITGLWQVKGRSLTSFDTMVRLDLVYIRKWSLWLDLKLLLATPFVVLRGKGAY